MQGIVVGGKMQEAKTCGYARIKKLRRWTDKLPVAFILALVDRREQMENSIC